MKHYSAIDGLRAWMAWWVVCQHVFNLSGMDVLYPGPVMRLLTSGGVAVLVFIIISGFVVTHLIITGKEAYGSYIIRRAARIYPLYIVALLAAILLRGYYFDAIVTPDWGLSQARLDRFVEQNTNFSAHLLAHLTLLHGIVPDSLLPDAASSFLSPAWSLSLEWQFYVLAPFVVAFFAGTGRSLVAVLVGLGLVFSGFLALVDFELWREPSFLPFVIGYFMIGVWARLGFTVFSMKSLLFVGLIISSVYWYSTVLLNDFWPVAILPILIWAVCYWFISSGGTSRVGGYARRIVSVFLATPSIVNMGKWSYSTYLLHIPLFTLVLGVTKQAGIINTQHQYFAAMLLSIPVLVAVSWLSYRFIEMPFAHLSKKLLNRDDNTVFARPVKAPK